jgi:type VI secretion system secreted protein Hcp
MPKPHAGQLLVLCGLALALFPAVRVMAAVDAFMTLTGAKQGPIKGETASGSIKLVSVTRDVSTGQPVGRRTHSTITITKQVDAASPKLAAAFSTNETLSNVTITFQGGRGGAKAVQRITLTNARILSARKHGQEEEFTLDYQAIEVTWTDGGKTASDDWEVPN